MKTEAEMRDELVTKAQNDNEFRRLLLADPTRAVGECLGINIPSDFELHVHEETETEHHLVLPNSSPLSENELSAVSGANHVWSPVMNVEPAPSG